MMLFIIMAACMYPVLLILYAMVRSQSKPGGGLLFGARLPEWLCKEPEVEQICRSFKKKLNLCTLVLALVPLAFLPIRYVSISMSLWILWVFAAIAVPMIPFVQANRAVREWKAERGELTDRGRTILAETRQLDRMHTLNPLLFLPPTAVSVAAVVLTALALWGQGLGVVTFSVGCFACCTLLFGVCAVWMDRQRLKVISSDSDVNLNYNQAQRRQWKHFWLAAAWLNAAFTMALALLFLLGGFATGMSVLLWGSLVYAAVILLLTVALLVGRNHLNQAYRDKMDLAGTVDDDDCWLGGMCYYNPRDTRVMVEKRFGVGTTMNMATAAGKATGVVLLVVLLGSLVLCAWMMRLEFTPIHLTCEEGRLVARQLGEDYVVELEDIRDLELVEELPAMSRTNGTGMDNLLKGSFRIKATGERVELFLDPRNSVFLTFTAGDTTYYMSCAEDAQTIELYQQLSE